MSTSEEIQGFDPEHDSASTPNGGKVKRMYEKLKGRGEDDAAEEIRHTDTVREQLRLAQRQPEFDPKHDDYRTSSKGEVARVFDWLVEHGHDGEAETLRYLGTAREQQNHAADLKRKYPIPKPGE